MLRRSILAIAGLLGLVGFLLDYGFHLPSENGWIPDLLSTLAVALFLCEVILAALTVRPWRSFLSSYWPALLLTLLLVGELAVVHFGSGGWLAPFLSFLSIQSMTQAYVVVAQIFILGNLMLQLPHLHTGLAMRRIRPGVLMVCLFLGLIIIGTGLLLLPRAVPVGESLNFLDALFTATSSVCVTGLIVRDTATQFTPMGQGIILLLIQLGGLGIMSLTATLSFLLGRGIGIRENSMLRELFMTPMTTEIGRLLRFIVLFTFMTEIIGAILLYLGLLPLIPDFRYRLFYAIFHAVSAFCNAGFSTFSESLVGVAGAPLVVGPIAGLLILGGLGFGVVINLLAFLRGRALGLRGGINDRFIVQTKVVLLLTGILLLVGTLLLSWLEWDGAFQGYGASEKLGLAFFQSATTRTAGFNTVDLTSLSTPSLFLMIILMFVGGASGSTAGGVKLSTVAIMWATLRGIAHGWPQARLWGREVSVNAVRRSMVVLSGALLLVALGSFLLLITERQPLLPTVFEVFSALGTVGLSLGLTDQLSTVGRVVVVMLMFVGRLGPLTMAYGLVPPSHERRIRLPEARIMVG